MTSSKRLSPAACWTGPQRNAPVDPTTLPELLCFAKLQGATDIEAYLRQQAPAHFAPRCESVRLPWND
jgi:hypothetical protein